jgi:hypothetical protein
MEYYISKDKSVVKYVHDDGSETAIKTQSGCQEFKNHLTGITERLRPNFFKIKKEFNNTAT